MFKFRGTKWKDMNRYEKVDFIYKLMAPVRIVLFPIMLLIKLYKWTYNYD